jgi:hypothetical protein
VERTQLLQVVTRVQRVPITSSMKATGQQPENDPKLLTAAVAEYRCYGFGYVLSGVAFGFLAILIGPLAESLFLVVFFGLFFGPAMFVFVLARMGRRALAAPTALSSYRAEGVGPMRRRVARILFMQAAGMFVLMALLSGLQKAPAAPFAAGAFVGMGMALLAMSRQFRRWEEGHAAVLLRAPRYRWRREAPGGPRGGGIMDPRDFYASARASC